MFKKTPIAEAVEKHNSRLANKRLGKAELVIVRESQRYLENELSTKAPKYGIIQSSKHEAELFRHYQMSQVFKVRQEALDMINVVA